jgi:hypothetical protein
MNIQSLSGVTKAVIALSAGGVLAGAIALGANGGGGGGSLPPAQVAAQTPTSEMEGATPAAKPPAFAYSNYIPPDAAALQEATQSRVSLDGAGQRCPSDYNLYDSKLLSGTFCYPPDWKVIRGDILLPPAAARGDGYGFSILVTKTEGPTSREVARVSIQIVGERPFTLLDCPAKGFLPVAGLQASSCFHERNQTASNIIQNGIARLIGFEVPRPVGESKALWIGVQIADRSQDYASVSFSAVDQAEAFEIVSSIRFYP